MSHSEIFFLDFSLNSTHILREPSELALKMKRRSPLRPVKTPQVEPSPQYPSSPQVATPTPKPSPLPPVKTSTPAGVHDSTPVSNRPPSGPPQWGNVSPSVSLHSSLASGSLQGL